MPIERTAIFVHRPRRIEELTDSGDAGKRKAYQVIRTVELTAKEPSAASFPAFWFSAAGSPSGS